MGATAGYNKQRKMELEKQRLINCRICGYHRGENATGRRPKSDRHKNPRRS